MQCAGAGQCEALGLAAGQAFGLTPYGTDAMHVLRAEKGYVIVGQETDGTVTPDDLGLGRMIGRSDVSGDTIRNYDAQGRLTGTTRR